MQEIYQICTRCGGTGKETFGNPVEGGGYEGQTRECIRCSGTGNLTHGYLPVELTNKISDMADKIDDILDSVNDIKEKIDEL